MAYLWEFFNDAYDMIGQGFGPGRFKATEIESYCRLTGQRLEPWEVRVLFALSDEYVLSYAKKKPISNTGDAAQSMQQVDMQDGAAVKALFLRGGRKKPAAKGETANGSGDTRN